MTHIHLTQVTNLLKENRKEIQELRELTIVDLHEKIQNLKLIENLLLKQNQLLKLRQEALRETF